MQDACNTQADCLDGFTCEQNLCVGPGTGGAAGGLGGGGSHNGNDANNTSSGNGGEPPVSASNFVVGCAGASIKAGGPAASLAFIVQPSQGMVHTPLCPVQVGFVDAQGNLDTNGGMHVSLSLIASPNATNATLTGVLAKDANHGIATFDQLVINTAASGYVLQVTASNGWTAKSNAFAVQVPAWTPLTTPAGSNASLSGDANGDVFIMNSAGLYESRDGGSTWPLADANAPFGSVMVDPLNGNSLYVEEDGCLFRSANGGATFVVTCGESNSCTSNGSGGVAVQAIDDVTHVLYGSNNSGVFSSADNGNTEGSCSEHCMNFHKRFIPRIQQITHHAREVCDRDPLVSSTIHGVIVDTHVPLTVQYLGRQRFMKDFLVFFERDAEVQPTVTTTGESLWSFLRKRRRGCLGEGADVLFVDDWLLRPDAAAVTYAPHFNALLQVRESMDVQCQHMTSKAHRRKIQAALKRGVTWRKSQSDADFALFYDDMYAPFVVERFGHDAATVTREQMYRIFKARGFLLLTEENGQPVSGAFMYTSPRQPGTLFYWKYGIAHASSLAPNVFGERNAATEAVVLKYAIDNNVRVLDFGLTRALPKNGIFTHKKRVGCTFQRHAGTPHFQVLFNPETRARFLQHFPLIVEANGETQCWLGRTGAPDGWEAQALEDDMHAGIVAPVTCVWLWMVARARTRLNGSR